MKLSKIFAVLALAGVFAVGAVAAEAKCGGEKKAEAKCESAKCGGEKKAEAKKPEAPKCGAAKCGGEKK
ncbi:MAG: hypothetical protein ACTTJS_02905 [Wolinella sp.]